jgi:putative oxidoreductase
MRRLIARLAHWNELFTRGMDWLSPGFLLALRVYVAMVFFKSGLTKVQDFSSTIALFENEYKVPVLSPQLAAISGTGTELLLPLLFVLGIASRPVALVFFIFNAVAVISYPDLSEAGLKDHMLWGMMMLVVLLQGAGRLSFDGLIGRRASPRLGDAESTRRQRA